MNKIAAASLRLFAIVLCGVHLALAFSNNAAAEVTSHPCPHSCRTMGIEKRFCRDWKQGNICYVEDLRPHRPPQPPQYEPPQQVMDRKIVLVNRSVLAGSRIEVGLPDGDREIDHFDIVVRGEGGAQRPSLSASIGDSIPLGRRPIERQDNHVAQFSANGTRPRGRQLILRAENGDVFVESVHILRR